MASYASRVMLRTRVLLGVFSFSFYGENSIKFLSPPFLMMALRNFVYGTRVFSKSVSVGEKSLHALQNFPGYEKFEKLDRIGFREI